MALSTRKGFGVEPVFIGVERDFKNSTVLFNIIITLDQGMDFLYIKNIYVMS